MGSIRTRLEKLETSKVVSQVRSKQDTPKWVDWKAVADGAKKLIALVRDNVPDAEQSTVLGELKGILRQAQERRKG